MAEVQVQEKGNKGGKVRSKKNSTRVDMTPMVDLNFLLLMFFMFTTTFTKPNIMDLTLPAKPDDKTTQVNLFYHQQDAKGLNESTLIKTSYDREGVEKVIEQAKKNAVKKENFTVIIKPVDDASFKHFVDILDEMEITGSEHFGISELKPFEKEVYEKKVK